MCDIESLFLVFEHVCNVDLKQLSTMRVGGKAKILIYPKIANDLVKIYEICKKNAIKMLILGNGSNVLFSDEGFDGAIIKLKHFQKFEILQHPTKNFNFSQKFAWKNRIILKRNLLKFKNRKFLLEKMKKKRNKFEKNVFLIEVGAGINLFSLNLRLKDVGASGLEFSYGIPATLGGFLRMNGGCFGHEVCEIVESVQVFDGKEVRWLDKRNLKFSYRDSNLKNCIILGAKLRFFASKSEKIEKRMNYFLQKKRTSQPCDLPSLGCVFKKSNGISAGKLIDELNLKGFSIGGAQVSSVHAGFVVNVANATSNDVKKLIFFLSERLKECGFRAETEIVFV